jgi:hypothetical protein
MSPTEPLVVTATRRRSVVRRLPVPRSEPPYDDERALDEREPGLPTGAVQGTLALSFLLPSGLPAVPSVPALRLLPALAGEPAGEPGTPPAKRRRRRGDHGFGPRPTPRAQLPEPRQWAGRFVQAVIEVLAGDRSVSQLIRWADPTVLQHLQQRCAAASPSRRQGGLRALVRSVRVTEPADGVAEVCALVLRGERVSAIALRFQGFDGRWKCTALEIGTDAGPGTEMLRRSASAGHRGSA